MRPQEVIFRADDPAGGLLCVLSGRVDLHLPNLRGGRTLVHAFGPGWWLGDLAAISGENRRFEHVAARPSKILCLSRAELSRLCKAHPAAWKCLAMLSAENLRLTVDAFEEHRMGDAKARIAACLLRLHRTGPGWQGRLPVSQADLASIALFSRRIVIGCLARLEEQGAVKRRYRNVEITDIGGLERSVRAAS